MGISNKGKWRQLAGNRGEGRKRHWRREQVVAEQARSKQNALFPPHVTIHFLTSYILPRQTQSFEEAKERRKEKN